jgi:hypothetical protein
LFGSHAKLLEKKSRKYFIKMRRTWIKNFHCLLKEFLWFNDGNWEVLEVRFIRIELLIFFFISATFYSKLTFSTNFYQFFFNIRPVNFNLHSDSFSFVQLNFHLIFCKIFVLSTSFFYTFRQLWNFYNFFGTRPIFKLVESN